ncbi:L-aminopeptidase/D-esterase-like protein [Paucibacter oligotrophus]|uniref:L-aminopeptidase/D-esterase-like protein n=1 Tax=Roseateles oligotrophus TaxID=1769250 RepID=A0A840LC26_9BURK|nr:hypothetical protein [Roseateles oligotrophus]MBB4845281.1 L-aminopeptidase/D-esterase-like protein [Roseateles oligotrophus]
MSPYSVAARREFELDRVGAGRGTMAGLIAGDLGSATTNCLARTIHLANRLG